MSCSKLWGITAALAATLAFGLSSAVAQPGLLPNADVETDSDMDGIPNDWFHSSDVSYPDDNGPSAPGTKSIQLNSEGEDWRSSEIPAVPGGKYTWSFDYKFLEGATGQFRADLRFFDDPNFAGEDAPLFSVSNIGQWQTSTRMLTAPQRTPNPLDGPFVLDVRLSSNLFAPGNGLVRFDNIIVTLIPEPSSIGLLSIAGCCGMFGRRRR
jgi:hypothetical protein